MSVLPIKEILFFLKNERLILIGILMLILRNFVFPPVNLINQNSELKIVTSYGRSLLKQTFVKRLMEDILLCLYN